MTRLQNQKWSFRMGIAHSRTSDQARQRRIVSVVRRRELDVGLFWATVFAMTFQIWEA